MIKFFNFSIHCLCHIWHKYKSAILLYQFRRNWRKFNSHNKTIALYPFKKECVTVGNKTYGVLDVMTFDNLDTKLIIGSYCSIASGVKFLLHSQHSYINISTFPFKVMLLGEKAEALSKGDIIVEDDVWIGQNAIICGGITIGQGAIIGTGAIVAKNVEPYSIVAGNPAKIIKYRFSDSVRKYLTETNVGKLFDNVSLNDIDLLYTPVNENNINDIILRLQKNN